MKYKYFECECLSPEHRLVFKYDKEDFYTEVYLRPMPNVFKRLLIVIKYVFTNNSNGNFEDFILDLKDVDYMINALQEYKQLRKENDGNKTM